MIIYFAQITANLQVMIALDLFDFQHEDGLIRETTILQKQEMHPFWSSTFHLNLTIVDLFNVYVIK